MKVSSTPFLKTRALWLLVPAVVGWANPALAQDAEEAVAYLPQGTADIMWLLITGFLVFFMQAGFAMVETGLTRAKNASNIMMKNLMDFSIGCLAFWAVGYSLMYGGDIAGLVGWNGDMFLMSGFSSGQDMHEAAMWLFQVVFAATAATIVSGAMAERTHFVAYCCYSLLISALLYPISGHWIWHADGWLTAMGMRDFAGSTVVHSVGAWAALAGCILIGPRIGKFGKDGRINVIPGHNMPLAALGVFILWFGWYGFNPGSTLAAADVAAHVAVTTTLAAAAGAIAAMTTTWFKFGKPDLSMSLNGTLAGLVAITAPCASVSLGSAIVIGACAGLLVVFSAIFFERVLRIDDPVGAISVHGVCGAWGTLAVGLFGQTQIDSGITDGLFFGGGFGQFGVQLLGVVSVFVFTFAAAFVVFTVLKATVGLRASEEGEQAGLDLSEHGSESYPDFQLTSDRT